MKVELHPEARQEFLASVAHLSLGVKEETSPYAYNLDVLWNPDQDVLL
jgi:hypothetical protein